ncbi:MAG: extracellular solute-binding protein [Spirochaetaceae bacterium]|jgi:multiple sugar transport system substrate-binding protein|nr:extracellular solute-binding protein [Spirochaetaceae bacterium]
MKKMFTIIALLAMVGGSLFANAQKDAGAASAGAGQKTVVFYSWWADAEKSMGDALIDDFEAAHPDIKVERNFIAYADYAAKLNTMIASNSAPDVMFLNEYLISEWGEKGTTADLNPYYAKAGVDPAKFFIPAALYANGGKLWGVAATSTTTVLYYNKEMFSAAGITLPPDSAAKPWGWADYVAAATKLTKDSSGKTPADAGFNYNDVIQWGTTLPSSWIYVLPLLYAGGSSVANADGTALEINKAAGVAAIQAMADLALKNKVAQTAAMSNAQAFTGLPAMLMNGQLGMFVGGTFQMGDFENEGYDVGIAQIPSNANPPKGSNMVWSSAYVMKKDASDEAFALISYLNDFNNWVKASTNHSVGLTGLPQTVTTLTSGTPQFDAWTKLYPASMAKVSGDILNNASRIGENVTLKNFSVIMDQTIAPLIDEIWLGQKTAADAFSGLDAALKPQLQGAYH